MSTENDSKIGAPDAMFGWLLAPIAILLALLADSGLDFGLVLEQMKLSPCYDCAWCNLGNGSTCTT